MVTLVVFATLVGFIVYTLIQHDRRQVREQRARSDKDWTERRRHERDHYCRLGMQLHAAGTADMDPDLYDSKWEYAATVHRSLVGDISMGVRVRVEPGCQVTEHQDGLVHQVVWLTHDDLKIPVLLCSFDMQVTTRVVDDRDALRVTCLRCALKSS